MPGLHLLEETHSKSLQGARGSSLTNGNNYSHAFMIKYIISHQGGTFMYVLKV